MSTDKTETSTPKPKLSATSAPPTMTGAFSSTTTNTYRIVKQDNFAFTVDNINDVWGRRGTPDQQPVYSVQSAEVKVDVKSQAIKAFFKPQDKPDSVGWLGKLGYFRGLTPMHTPQMPAYSLVRRSSALEALAEKMAADLYTYLSEGNYGVAKTRLAELPIKNPYTEQNSFTQALYAEINEGRKEYIDDGVYVLSKWVKNYQDLGKLKNCMLGDEQKAFINFLNEGKLPEYIILNGKKLPLFGLMDILAAGRLLGDTDVLGGGGNNAGIEILYAAGEAIAVRVVKIDPGFAFNFRGLENQFFQSRHPDAHSSNLLKQDKRNLQYGNSSLAVLPWGNLTTFQQQQFTQGLDGGLKALRRREEIAKMMNRQAFKQTPKKQELPSLRDVLGENGIGIEENLAWQEETYANELKQCRTLVDESVHREPIVDVLTPFPILTTQYNSPETAIASSVTITTTPFTSTLPVTQVIISPSLSVFHIDLPASSLTQNSMTPYAQQVEATSKIVQDKINPQELAALLKWVTEGHLVEVERLLKKNSTLALGTWTITDLSNRTFKNITVLQYAAWALDPEMCELIINYVGVHQSAIQLKALAEEHQIYGSHGASYDAKPLDTKYRTYFDNSSKWSGKELDCYWKKEIGGEQRKCPAWLIYAWNEEGIDVAWTRGDVNRKIKREYGKHQLKWWFTKNYSAGRGVGSSWAAWRARRAGCIPFDVQVNHASLSFATCGRPHPIDASYDQKCVSDLVTTHRATLQQLTVQVDSQLNQDVSVAIQAPFFSSPSSKATATMATAITNVRSPSSNLLISQLNALSAGLSSSAASSPPTTTPVPAPMISRTNINTPTTVELDSPGLSGVSHPPFPFFPPSKLNQEKLAYAQQVEAASKWAQDKMDPTELSVLLKWVTEGHLVEVEKWLKKNPSLALGTGMVKDRSDRTFNNMTALQYAAWALDTEMCELIINYIGTHHSMVQLKALAEKPPTYNYHSLCYDAKPLITKYQTYFDNYYNWGDVVLFLYWQKEIGGEQRKCPAWLIYAWSEEGEDTAWAKQDPNRKIKREYDKHHLDWWFAGDSNQGRGVGSTWAVARGAMAARQLPCWEHHIHILTDGQERQDQQCVSDLVTTRKKTLQRLMAEVEAISLPMVTITQEGGQQRGEKCLLM